MTENSVLEILSAFIHNRKPCFNSDANERRLYYSFYIQGLLPILAYMDKKWEIISDATIKQSLVECYYQTIAENFNKAEMFEAISQKLSAECIPHMPVKGWYIRTLYPVSELRTFGDIDILIRKTDREKADAIFTQNGYTVKDNWEPTYTYDKGLLRCEVHTELMDSDLGKGEQVIAYFSNALKSAESDAGERLSPQKELHLVYLFCHLAKHLYKGGAGIRMYLDIALFLKEYADILNFDKILNDFKKLKLDRFFKTVTLACGEWFKIDLPFEITDIKTESIDALKEYTFGADIFGKTRDKSIISLRNDDAGTKSSVLKDTFFPSSEKIEERYKFIKGRKYLLPVAWVARSVVNLKDIPQKLRFVKKVSNADMDLVNEYDVFITDIGL